MICFIVNVLPAVGTGLKGREEGKQESQPQDHSVGGSAGGDKSRGNRKLPSFLPSHTFIPGPQVRCSWPGSGGTVEVRRES